MHFNEMSVKARQFGLTFVAAALGLGVVMLSRGPDFVLSIPYLGFDLHGVVLLVLASAFALFAVSLLDLKVYHRMLRGAVTFGEDFEANYMKQIFQLEKGMTQAISHYSRFDDAEVDRTGAEISVQRNKAKICGIESSPILHGLDLDTLHSSAGFVLSYCKLRGKARRCISSLYPWPAPLLTQTKMQRTRDEPMRTKAMLVCDLDNTLYDWVGYFVPSFNAMVNEALPILGCGREQLLDDLREVHQRHHDFRTAVCSD